MKIKLEAWAAKRYTPAPSLFTLRKWARDGDISPAPEKVGRDWYVEEDAQRIVGGALPAPRPSLVSRIQGARA